MNILKLKGKIVEKGVNIDDLAIKIGMNRSTLYRKLSMKNKTPFTIDEAKIIKDVLALTSNEVISIFFD